ncbi:MAG: hypothetical protein JWP92_2970 [Caulobacter sp.]|nr:hypothetical protein [Caulobacter sp.]
MKPYAIVAALSAALGLAACNAPARTGGNAKICADFTVAKPTPGSPAAGGGAAVDECVKRWAYSLAPSRDEADIVAEAVKAACGTQLSAWNQQTVNQPGAAGEATSLLTGEPTSPLAEHNAYVARRALFYVVQARAGSCPAPPAKDGAPEGVG